MGGNYWQMPWLPQQNNTPWLPTANGGRNTPAQQTFNFWGNNNTTMPGYGTQSTNLDYLLDPNYSAYSELVTLNSSNQAPATTQTGNNTSNTSNTSTTSRENPLANWWRNSGLGVGFYQSTKTIQDQIFEPVGGQLESHLINQNKNLLKGNANFLEFNSSGMSSERYIATRMINARKNPNINFGSAKVNTKLAQLDAGIDVLESKLGFFNGTKLTNWRNAKIGTFNTKFPTLGKINSAPERWLSNLAETHPKAMGGTCTALKWGGRACFVASVAIEGYGVYKIATDPAERQKYIDNEINGNPLTISLNHEPSTGEVTAIKTCDAVGGLAGAYVGGEIGATLGSFVFPPIGTVVGGVLGGAIGYVVGSGLGKNIAVGVANCCKAIGDGAKAVGEWVGEKATQAKQWVGKKVDQAKTAIKQTYNKVKTAVKQTYNKAKTFVKDTYNKAKTAVKQTYNKAKTFVKDTYNNAKTAVKQTYNKAKTVVKDTYNKAKSTAKKAWNTIKSWF